VCNYVIVSSRVAISGCNVTLRCGLIPVSAQRPDECREVAIFVTDGYAAVPIPSVKHGFLCVVWYDSGLLDRRLGVVRLPCGELVEWLKVQFDAASRSFWRI
jgi:hypothetical protein